VYIEPRKRVRWLQMSFSPLEDQDLTAFPQIEAREERGKGRKGWETNNF